MSSLLDFWFHESPRARNSAHLLASQGSAVRGGGGEGDTGFMQQHQWSLALLCRMAFLPTPHFNASQDFFLPVPALHIVVLG